MVKAHLLSYFLLLCSCCYFGWIVYLGISNPGFDWSMIGHRGEGILVHTALILYILVASSIVYGFIRVIRGKLVWF